MISGMNSLTRVITSGTATFKACPVQESELVNECVVFRLGLSCFVLCVVWCDEVAALLPREQIPKTHLHVLQVFPFPIPRKLTKVDTLFIASLDNLVINVCDVHN